MFKNLKVELNDSGNLFEDNLFECINNLGKNEAIKLNPNQINSL